MFLSALLTSVPGEFETALGQVAELGFSQVDIVALENRSVSHREALADSGLLVSCAALGRNLPEGCTLDAANYSARKQAVEIVKQHLIDAAQLGATHGFLIPGMDDSEDGLLRYADSVALLADFARSRMIQLCIEHFPRKALPTVSQTLEWLEDHQLDQAQLLLDTGHCLISEEDPARAATEAGSRLGYVHFDDNDSVDDLHWPLLTGRLTQDMIDSLLAVLLIGKYQSGLCLELNPQNENPLADLRKGKEILERAMRQRVD